MKNDAFCRALGLKVTIEPEEVLFRPMSDYKKDYGDVIVLYTDVDTVKAGAAFRLGDNWYLRCDQDPVKPIYWAPACPIMNCDMVPFIKAS